MVLTHHMLLSPIATSRTQDVNTGNSNELFLAEPALVYLRGPEDSEGLLWEPQGLSLRGPFSLGCAWIAGPEFPWMAGPTPAMLGASLVLCMPARFAASSSGHQPQLVWHRCGSTGSCLTLASTLSTTIQARVVFFALHCCEQLCFIRYVPGQQPFVAVLRRL